jgi:hypothetical protein
MARNRRQAQRSAALALAEIGETDLADQYIRHQARIGGPATMPPSSISPPTSTSPRPNIGSPTTPRAAPA